MSSEHGTEHKGASLSRTAASVFASWRTDLEEVNQALPAVLHGLLGVLLLQRRLHQRLPTKTKVSKCRIARGAQRCLGHYIDAPCELEGFVVPTGVHQRLAVVQADSNDGCMHPNMASRSPMRQPAEYLVDRARRCLLSCDAVYGSPQLARPHANLQRCPELWQISPAVRFGRLVVWTNQDVVRRPLRSRRVYHPPSLLQRWLSVCRREIISLAAAMKA